MNALTYLRAGLSVLARNLGLTGWLGVALLLAAAWGLQWSEAQKQALSSVLSTQALVRERNTGPSAGVTNVAPAVASATASDASAAPRDLDALGDLPTRDPKTAITAAALMQQAQRRGVRLQSVEYRWQKPGARAMPIQRLDLTMTAQGTYPQLRTWMNELLVKYPNAQLVETAIERKDESALEARLVMAVHFRIAGNRV